MSDTINIERQNKHIRRLVIRVLSDVLYIYSLVMKCQTDKANRSLNMIYVLFLCDQLKMY